MLPTLINGVSAPPGFYDADIIILTIGRVNDTIAAISSARAQTGVSAHVTVLDQGSLDAEFNQLRDALGNVTDVSLYRTEINLGVAGGRNFLSDVGHGAFIVSLDNDAVFADEQVVAGAIRDFQANPRLGALGFQILNHNGTALDEYSWGYPPALQPRRHGQFLTTTFVGAGHAIRRAAWEQAGGYDEKLFFTWEEHDFCLAAIAAHWEVGYNGALAVWHKLASQHRVSWNDARVKVFVRNRLVIARKWHETLPVFLARIGGYLINGIVNHQIRTTLAGIVGGLTMNLSRRRRMSPEMRDYIYTYEAQFYGPMRERIQRKVFGRRPMESPAAPTGDAPA